MSKLRIALIDDDLERAQFIHASLLKHNFHVSACLIVDTLDMVKVKNLNADIILLNMDHPQRDIIESCVSQYELPTVLFTKNAHKETIKSAIDAGVTAYIVDGIDPSKLDHIMEISIEQFRKHKKLLDDLKETQDKLADRKDIDRAKALLIQLHGLSEEQAFALLRKNSMSHRVTLGDMARRLLEAQKLLSGQ
ncbi:histidine kinase (plasmid) [Acinetobacter sp. NCu2D-2]|uniref:ANTAR domain-containing response regulator n=1 Tax=Acinetobacter sp. NCu2D-2 TaxID=1608473 RepID=UPI0007CDF609|nr:ANTAR domain-containing protein [Acinetobacter sp. NCu2D-2]ANF83427.1 histidine kinase [Acinetobacter sp. NCu2D-2]